MYIMLNGIPEGGALFTPVRSHRTGQLELNRCQVYPKEHNIELCEIRTLLDLRMMSLRKSVRLVLQNTVPYRCRPDLTLFPFHERLASFPRII